MTQLTVHERDVLLSSLQYSSSFGRTSGIKLLKTLYENDTMLVDLTFASLTSSQVEAVSR